jgi:hypothetical protein
MTTISYRVTASAAIGKRIRQRAVPRPSSSLRTFAVMSPKRCCGIPPSTSVTEDSIRCPVVCIPTKRCQPTAGVQHDRSSAVLLRTRRPALQGIRWRAVSVRHLLKAKRPRPSHPHSRFWMVHTATWPSAQWSNWPDQRPLRHSSTRPSKLFARPTRTLQSLDPRGQRLRSPSVLCEAAAVTLASCVQVPLHRALTGTLGVLSGYSRVRACMCRACRYHILIIITDEQVRLYLPSLHPKRV